MPRHLSLLLAAAWFLLPLSLAQAGALDRPNQTGNPLDPPSAPPRTPPIPTATPEASQHLKGTSLDQAPVQKYTLVGRVVEKSAGGLIVSCYNPGTSGNKKARGDVYLTGYPEEARVFEGVTIKCSATETGTHVVTSASGTTRTVQAFSFLSR